MRILGPTRILTLMALILTIAFQNCVELARNEKTTGSSMDQAQPGANGEGYDGKLYNLVNAGGVCADGNPIASTILVKNGIGLMIRQNCHDLSGNERFEVPLVFSANDKRILIYEGEEYLLQYIQYSKLKRDPNSQLLAIGTVWNAGGENLASLTQLGANGNPNFSLTYDHDFKEQTLQFSNAVTTAGGWLASGNPMDLRLDSALRTPQPAFLAKFNTSGKTQWVRSYGENLSEGQKLHFKDVHASGDGSALVAATFETYAPGANVLSGSQPTAVASGLVKFDSSGNRQSENWWKDISIHEMHAVDDGGSLLVALSNGSQMVAKIDVNGNVEWAKLVNMKVESARVLADRRIALSGYQELGSSIRTRTALALLSSDGNLSWSRSFKSSDESGMAMLHDLVENPGVGLYTVGFADRTVGRVATWYHVADDGRLTASSELKPGYSARWKRALLLAPNTLWTSLVNSDFGRIENSLNEILMRLNPQASPPCAACASSTRILEEDLNLSLTSVTLENASPPLSWNFSNRSLRPRTLGYPIFVSP